MKKLTLTVFETQRNQILSALGFCGINEFAIKKNSATDKIDVSISCEPIKLFEIGIRFQFEVQESKSISKVPTA